MAIVSKSELMARVIAGQAHECFEHSDDGIFDITLMREWAAANLTPVSVLLEDIVPHILQTRDTEPERVFELDEESWRNDPGMAVIYEQKDPPEHLMIDGHHRALRRAAAGLTEMLMYIVPQSAVIRPAPGWVINPFADWGKKVFKDGKLVDRE